MEDLDSDFVPNKVFLVSSLFQENCSKKTLDLKEIFPRQKLSPAKFTDREKFRTYRFNLKFKFFKVLFFPNAWPRAAAPWAPIWLSMSERVWRAEWLFNNFPRARALLLPSLLYDKSMEQRTNEWTENTAIQLILYEKKKTNMQKICIVKFEN